LKQLNVTAVDNLINIIFVNFEFTLQMDAYKNIHKKLSCRRETARQLRMSI